MTCSHAFVWLQTKHQRMCVRYMLLTHALMSHQKLAYVRRMTLLQRRLISPSVSHLFNHSIFTIRTCDKTHIRIVVSWHLKLDARTHHSSLDLINVHAEIISIKKNLTWLTRKNLVSFPSLICFVFFITKYIIEYW